MPRRLQILLIGMSCHFVFATILSILIHLSPVSSISSSKPNHEGANPSLRTLSLLRQDQHNWIPPSIYSINSILVVSQDMEGDVK